MGKSKLKGSTLFLCLFVSGLICLSGCNQISNNINIEETTALKQIESQESGEGETKLTEITASAEETENQNQITGTKPDQISENNQTSAANTDQSEEQNQIKITGIKPDQTNDENQTSNGSGRVTEKVLTWNADWEYAEFSAIHADSVKLYTTSAQNKKGKVICINAGHGTSGGNQVYTLCHPDGSPKVTGGSTSKGSTKAAAVSSGTTMNDGTSEAEVTRRLAVCVKNLLLEKGYDVLMIRETEDVQLDNIARTVFANQYADCHIALHYDSSQSDKGMFYIGVPDISSYRNMEPVASHWKEHNKLGQSLVNGMKSQNVKVYGNGCMNLDLTQMSYATIPTVTIEVGDRSSDYSQTSLNKLASGVVNGVDEYFGQ